jgi:hypothetical protein
MTQSRLARRRARRAPWACWLLTLLASPACSEAQEAAPPFTPAPSMSVDEGTAVDESTSPISDGP